jgi:hypothetical protein
MTKEELINSLPGDLQPWAEIWLPVMVNWSEDKLTSFINNSIGGTWVAAYQMLVDDMTTEQKIAEMKMRQQELLKLNQDNAAFVSQQRELFLSIIARAILALKT